MRSTLLPGGCQFGTDGGTGTCPLSRTQIEMALAAKPINHSSATRSRWTALPGHLSYLLLIFLTAALSWWPHDVLAARAVGTVSVGSGHGAYLPGEEVTLSWSALPEGTDEFELLLVCRSPIPVKLRLTECLDPLQGTYLWRVPNLPCDAARLVIRTGLNGEEITWAASPPFRIGWDAREPFVQVTSRGGELWLSKPEHRPRKTWAWGSDSASPGALPGRSEEVGAPPPVPDLAPPETSSGEVVPHRGRESADSWFRPSGRPAFLKFQFRI